MYKKRNENSIIKHHTYADGADYPLLWTMDPMQRARLSKSMGAATASSSKHQCVIHDEYYEILRPGCVRVDLHTHSY